MSGIVSLVAGWRKTKLKCTIWLWGEKNLHFFFSFSEQYQHEYHCYSKCLALFCLETLELQRQLSLTPAGQSVSLWVGESEWGGERECPLSASLPWSRVCEAAAPQRSTSYWASFDPPSVWQDSSSIKTGHLHPSTTHGISNGHPAPPLDYTVALPSPPSLSCLTQRSL